MTLFMETNILENLTTDILSKVPVQYREVVVEAISWSKKKYTAHSRLSGENTIFHALRVANCAGDLHLDTDSILVAVFHCILNEEQMKSRGKNLQEIKDLFGEDVAKLLEILDKINQGTDSEETDKKIITRYVLRNSEDIRGILIKICDVLDDVRTLKYLSKEEIKTKAEKIYNIYGPLCSYLNLEPIKKEIEEIAFEYTKPEEYAIIEEKMQKEGLNENLLEKYREELEELTDILKYKPKIFGRIKSKYSMYNKLKKLENEGENTALAKIKDRIAFSIVTKTKEDCFLLKLALEEKIEINEQETDDYIANPKPNGFQALQMSISCPKVKDIFVEIQILTDEMYYINTYGPASHIAYKASKKRFAKPTDSFKWIGDLHRKIIQSQPLSKQARSVPIRADIFKNYIYIFTPKGRIIELNQGATAVDFAYRVHTKIGHNATFAKINGETKDLSTQLHTGEVVHIVTSNQDKYPNRDWLDFVVADSTKEKIRKALKLKSTSS